jgi:ribosome recycling factor
VAASSLAPAVSRAIAPVQVVGIVPSASFAKKNDKGKDKDAGKKGGKKGSSSSDGEEGDGNAETFGVNVAEHKENMENVITYFEAELTHIKIGRPAPEQIEDVSVDIGGGKRSPLGSIAQIYVKPPQSLVVVLYEPSAPLETATCQAIAAAGLDLNPISEIINGAAAIRVPFPKPTTELRESLVKSAKTKGEDFKGQVRHVRKAWLDAIKKKSPPEDAARRVRVFVFAAFCTSFAPSHSHSHSHYLRSPLCTDGDRRPEGDRRCQRADWQARDCQGEGNHVHVRPAFHMSVSATVAGRLCFHTMIATEQEIVQQAYIVSTL